MGMVSAAGGRRGDSGRCGDEERSREGCGTPLSPGKQNGNPGNGDGKERLEESGLEEQKSRIPVSFAAVCVFFPFVLSPAALLTCRSDR